MNRPLIISASALVLALAVALSFGSSPQMTEQSANFTQNDKVDLRFIIQKAGILYRDNYSFMVDYVKSELLGCRSLQPSRLQLQVLPYWHDSTHLNKRYFQVSDSEPYGFSILILETNNTRIDQLAQSPRKIAPSNMQVSAIDTNQLQYSKNKSAYVTTAQEAGVDLAITTAYTWNKNIVDFTKVLQKLIETNLNEHWEVCTSFDNLQNFQFRYTSPYDQWIEYSNYGIGSTHWHVFVWRNFITQ